MKQSQLEQIQNQILEIIGTPKYYSNTKVTKIGDHSFRINVYTKDISGVIEKNDIAFSSFIIFNDNGDIIEAEPPLKRLK